MAAFDKYHFMKIKLPLLATTLLLTGCDDEMPDLAGRYLLNGNCDQKTFLDHSLTLNSEYLPNIGYTYSLHFPHASPILPGGHPLRSYRSNTHPQSITTKFYRPSSHTGVDGFESDLTLHHLPNGDLLLQQWNIKSWHHTTRGVTEHTLESTPAFDQYAGTVENREGTAVSGLCLRAKTKV